MGQLHRVIVQQIVQTSRKWNDPLEVTFREEILHPTKGWQWTSPAVIKKLSRYQVSRLKGMTYGKLKRQNIFDRLGF